MRYLLAILIFIISFSAKSQNIVIGTVGSPCIGASGINFCDKTCVFIGNSITRGVLPVNLGNQKWTSVFCHAKYATELNMGIDGQTMSNSCGIVVFNPATIPAYNPSTHSALFISLGENDIGWNSGGAGSTPAEFKTAYTTAVTSAISTYGWPPSRVILLAPYQPYSWNAYVGACGTSVAADAARALSYVKVTEDVASENGCLYRNVYAAMNGLDATYFDVDGLHPNAVGDSVIANFLITSL